MKKVFFLKTCSTCRKIMDNFPVEDWEHREIKSAPITEEELQEMHRKTNSYEALFSKKSTQIKAKNLDVKTLQEKDFKALLLEHYTFLKRPVFLTNDAIFVGNEKANIENLQQYFSKD